MPCTGLDRLQQQISRLEVLILHLCETAEEHSHSNVTITAGAQVLSKQDPID